jgi:hypothetical protein
MTEQRPIFINTKAVGQLTMYHGTDQKHEKLRNTPIWGGLNYQDANSYAKTSIWILQNTRPLNLINVMHPAFHDDFMARINTAFNDIQDFSLQRVYPLAMFGLPDLTTQIGVLGKQPGGVYPDSALGYDPEQRMEVMKILSFTSMYGNKHTARLKQNGTTYFQLIE